MIFIAIHRGILTIQDLSPDIDYYTPNNARLLIYSYDGGRVGSVILAYEKQARYYSMTISYLTLVRESLRSINDQYKMKKNGNHTASTYDFQADLIATINFVTIHIFTDLHRWNFSDPGEQEQMGNFL